MKIYVAASMPRVQEAHTLSEKLKEYGHVITSYWHNTDVNSQKSKDYHYPDKAQRDKDAVEACDVFIELVGDSGKSRGGRHCELGLALAWKKQIILIGGDDDCIFTWLPGLTKIESIEKFITERLENGRI